MKRCLTLGLALCLAACDGGGGGTDAGMMGTDAGMMGTDAGGGGTPVDVVFETRDGTRQEALAGVMVALDRPDGSREEVTSDAMGRLTLAIDWSAGPVDLTIYLSGYAVVSFLDVTAESLVPFEDGGVFPLPTFRNTERTDLVTLSGTVTNGSASTNRYQVTSDTRGGEFYNDLGADYTMTVPTGEALRITVLEYDYVSRGTNDYTQNLHNIGLVDVAAITADTTLDLDISASPQTLMEVAGSITSPGMGTPLADANFYAVVGDSDGVEEFYGAVSSATPNGDDVDYTIGFIQPAHAREPAVRYILQDDPLFSQIVVLGWPTAGGPTQSFLAPPEIVVPSFGESHPIHDAFQVGRVTPGTETSISIFDVNADDRVIWQANSASGSETLTLPDLPSAANRAEVFPATADLYARPLVCERTGGNRYCDRLAVGGRQFDLVP